MSQTVSDEIKIVDANCVDVGTKIILGFEWIKESWPLKVLRCIL